MAEYEELWGGKAYLSFLPYKNHKQVGINFRRGNRNDFYMVPVATAEEAIIEIQQAIDEVKNGIIK